VKRKGGIIVTKDWVLDQHAQRKQFPPIGRYLLDVATAEDAMVAAGCGGDDDDGFIVDDDDEEEADDDDDSDGVCGPLLPINQSITGARWCARDARGVSGWYV
jgi:hypothetical protein